MLKQIGNFIVENVKKRNAHIEKVYTKKYPGNYIHLASCEKTFQKGKKLYTYTHYDYFLIDTRHSADCTKAKRLTGDYAENSFTTQDIKKIQRKTQGKDGKEYLRIIRVRIQDNYNTEVPLTYTLIQTEPHLLVSDENMYSINDLQIEIADLNKDSIKKATIKPELSEQQKQQQKQQQIDALFESFAGHK